MNVKAEKRPESVGLARRREMTKRLIFMTILSAAGVLFLITRVIRSIRWRQRRRICEASGKVVPLYLLNSRFSFHEIPQTEKIKKDCLSMEEYDQTKLNEYTHSYVTEHFDEYSGLAKKVRQNQINYEEYLRLFRQIIETETEKDSENYKKHRYFKKKELKICQSLAKTPTTDFSLTATKKCLGPRGRSLCSESEAFDIDFIESALTSVRQAEKTE